MSNVKSLFVEDKWAQLCVHNLKAYWSNWLTCVRSLYFTVIIGSVLFTKKRPCRKFQWQFKAQNYLSLYLLWRPRFELYSYKIWSPQMKAFEETSRSYEHKHASEMFCPHRAQPFQTRAYKYLVLSITLWTK